MEHSWSTPQDTFDALNAEFGFEWDLCATAENAKCAKFYSPEQDSLLQWWGGTCWLNPPYGRRIHHWVGKAYNASMMGATVVCLLPAKTDTAWWHMFCMKGEIRFIQGRLRFGDGTGNGRFASAIVIFRPLRRDYNGRRVCSRCACQIGKHHKYRFVGSAVEHRDCKDPTLAVLAATLRAEQADLLPEPATADVAPTEATL